uniref:Uncharacterized protein n=1 Tax=Arundo donax TaxID=35708 RepID=A0A0A9LCT7_ARUDO
MQSTKQAKKQW